MAEQDTHRGARIGMRVAHIISQAIVATHAKLLDVKHRLAVMVFNTISNEISDEVHNTIGHLVRHLAAETETTGHATPILEFLGNDRGQLKAIAGSSALSGSVLWALGTIISNELAPATYANVAQNPHLAPDSGTAAQMVAVGAVSEADARYAMAGNGHGGRWQDGFLEIAKNYPGVSELGTLYNMGVIGRDEFTTYARKSGVPAELASKLLALSRTPTSMQDAALAYLRGGIDREYLNKIGNENGYDPDAIDVYLDTIGEPPGTMELLEAYRRGFIDQGRLERGILQSRTRNEWISVIEQLRYSPMSIADAVNASVQGHMSKDDAARVADQNGLEPGAYEILYETAGSPLSRTELNDLYNRGVIGSDVVLQGLRESRMKDKYIGDAFALRRRLLEPSQIGEAVFHNLISHQQGVELALEHGFTADDATVLIGAASGRKLQSFKDRVISAAETMFVDNVISAENLKRTVLDMGYEETEAELVIQAATLHRETKIYNTAVNAIRSKFIAHHVTEDRARSLLNSAGVQPDQREHLLKLWDVEAAANARVLTAPQVLKALAYQLISEQDALVRLQQMGYSAEDAGLLMGGA